MGKSKAFLFGCRPLLEVNGTLIYSASTKEYYRGTGSQTTRIEIGLMSLKIRTVISFKIRNMMDLSLIEEASSVRCAEVAHSKDIDELRILAKQKRNSLIICDLSVLSPEETEAVSKVASGTQSITFGYYPHVSDEIRISAIKLGFNFVVPRSAFRAKFKSVLA